MYDQSRFNDYNEYNDYLTRKLKHYNEWLMDPKRDLKIPKPYPGFPEDLIYKQAIESLREDYTQRQEAKKPETPTVVKEKKTRAKRAKKAEGPSRQILAQEIYKRLNGDRAAVVQAIQDELGMPPGSAMTYFYNAKKSMI